MCTIIVNYFILLYDTQLCKYTLHATGVLSMYNFEKNENASQFLITFKPLTTLDERHVVFGRVIYGLKTLRSVCLAEIR